MPAPRLGVGGQMQKLDWANDSLGSVDRLRHGWLAVHRLFHDVGSANQPNTNQPATARSGTMATAISSKGAGSLPVLSGGLSSLMGT